MAGLPEARGPQRLRAATVMRPSLAWTSLTEPEGCAETAFLPPWGAVEERALDKLTQTGLEKPVFKNQEINDGVWLVLV